jgi:deoxyribodipyrimidine photolyase-related protein
MKTAGLIYPHQLFSDTTHLDGVDVLVVIEDPLFFGTDPEFQTTFHKQKLVFHRATMQRYRNKLEDDGHRVKYVEFGDIDSSEGVFDELEDVEEVHMAALADIWLERRITRAANTQDIELHTHPSPGFLTDRATLNEYFDEHENYYQTDFYKFQRKRLDVLMDGDKPVGGKWTFDTENRKKLPTDKDVPAIPDISHDDYVKEAKRYVETHFADNPGSLEQFIYPTSHEQASDWLDDFLAHRLYSFGPYQDAIEPDEPFLFHSLLSPCLNAGLLTPREVVSRVEEYGKNHRLPLNSREGFVRQMIGWREFMRAIYEREGGVQRTRNFWGFDRSIPNSFWSAETGVEPIDATIERVQRFAYAHHIERLMILGNFMLLCEFDPKEVYEWFMELFIDAYDWVMVPNVYGMSQYADGGLITTKPYISSSNYVRKMSHYKKGDWCEVWDGLYWRFIDEHKEKLKDNGRMGQQLALLDRMNKDTKRQHREVAESFLQDL